MTRPKASFLLRFSDHLNRRRQEGQGMVEYALILVLVAIVAIIAVTAVGQQTSDTFNRVAAGLTTSSDGGGSSKCAPCTYTDDFSSTWSGSGNNWSELGPPSLLASGSGTLTVDATASDSDDFQGVYKPSPTAPFTVTTEIISGTFTQNYQKAGLFLSPAGAPGPMFGGQAQWNAGLSVQALNYSSPFLFNGPVGDPIAIRQSSPIYLRLVVHSDTNVDFYYSYFGTSPTWTLVKGGMSPPFTIGSVGLAVDTAGNGGALPVIFGPIVFTTATAN
jgi:pilus assembly protein Flp/PilA